MEGIEEINGKGGEGGWRGGGMECMERNRMEKIEEMEGMEEIRGNGGEGECRVWKGMEEMEGRRIVGMEGMKEIEEMEGMEEINGNGGKGDGWGNGGYGGKGGRKWMEGGPTEGTCTIAVPARTSVI